MKTIKIFLASSDELKHDRDAFGNLVRRLDDIYEKRGIRLKLCPWEDLDAAYNDRRKQDEYNDHVRTSDLFLALFHIKAGKFTIEEFNVASEEFRKHASPKVFVYCKDLQPDEKESAELAEFKRVLYEELGHYWCRYGNSDTMQLHFVMQLQLVENSQMEALKVEEDGCVTLDGTPIAHMDQLPFATGNEAYQKMSAELLSLPDEIDKARQRAEKYPDDEDLKDELQKKLNRHNQLKEEFLHLQENLFATAKTITGLQLQQVNARVRRAIEAFETGNLERANTILEENEREADRHMERLEQNKELVHKDIDAFKLQTKTIIADVNVPIADRIARVTAIYEKADDWASRSAYDQEHYLQLLLEYTAFLNNYGYYKDAEQIYSRIIIISEILYGADSPKAVLIYNNIGHLYYSLEDYQKAIYYFNKAIAIGIDVHDPTIAAPMNGIGLVYGKQQNYEKAKECFLKALTIFKTVYGEKHYLTASVYHNLGGVYRELGDYTEALDYFFKALEIKERVLGTNHHKTAISYDELGSVYDRQGNLNKAIEYHLKAITILQNTLGFSHPDTLVAYRKAGMVYYKMGDLQKTLEFLLKSLDNKNNDNADTADIFILISGIYLLQEKYEPALESSLNALSIQQRLHLDTTMTYNVLGRIYIAIATSYTDIGDYKKALSYYQKAYDINEQLQCQEENLCHNIGVIYANLGDYNKALEFFFKAVEVTEQTGREEHSSIANYYNSICAASTVLGKYQQALEYATKASEITERTIGKLNPQMVACYNSFGELYYMQHNYNEALEYYLQALFIQEQILNSDHPDIARTCNNIAKACLDLGDISRALGYCSRAITIKEKTLGNNHPSTAKSYLGIGQVYERNKDFFKALEYASKAHSIFEKNFGPEHPDTQYVRRYIEQLRQKISGHK